MEEEKEFVIRQLDFRYQMALKGQSLGRSRSGEKENRLCKVLVEENQEA